MITISFYYEKMIYFGFRKQQKSRSGPGAVDSSPPSMTDRPAAAASSTAKLSDHFPRVERPCRHVAATFFACFTGAGRMTDAQVSD
jgi:hypothetical protein